MRNCIASAAPPIPYARAIDTIEIAKSKIPGARYSLDELCKRFGIDLSARTKHGALLDAELTAQVYLELVGGRQKRLSLSPDRSRRHRTTDEVRTARARPEPLAVAAHAGGSRGACRFVAEELGDGCALEHSLRRFLTSCTPPRICCICACLAR